MLLTLVRDQNEIVSPKIRRALLLNILPQEIHERVFEHLDRLKDYQTVREKVISLVQAKPNADATDCNNVTWTEDEWYNWCEDHPEDATHYSHSREDDIDLADQRCHRCGGKVHFACDCGTPPEKGGKAKGGKKGGPKGGGKA